MAVEVGRAIAPGESRRTKIDKILGYSDENSVCFSIVGTAAFRSCDILRTLLPVDSMIRTRPACRWLLHWTCLTSLAAALLGGTSWAADPAPVAARRPLVRPRIGPYLKLPAVFRKPDPQNVGDLLSMEHHVSGLIKAITRATVGVQIGRAQGSGVIVSPDGFVLTAGHVSGVKGRRVTIIFPDGTRVRGITLGANHGIDSGLIRITDKGPWPFLNIGRLKDVKVGDWCIATGHPGGFKPGRPPVVRLGRVIVRTDRLIRTDATLVGGIPAARCSTCTAG